MQVWTYPEKRLETFGAVRWIVQWWTLRPGCENKEEWNPDSDLIEHYTAHKTEAAALKAAKGAAKKSHYGAALVQEQRVDWFVEEDRVAEWTDVGDSEEVTA